MLQADPQLLLQQHGQIPVSIATAQGAIGIPAGAIHLDAHAISQQHAHQQHIEHNQITREVRVMTKHTTHIPKDKLSRLQVMT